jgi:two-component system, NtrC family, response regulator AtoC
MEQNMKTIGNILVIDDDPNFSKLLHYNLVKEGYTADVASSGHEALDKIASDTYNILLVDYRLPDMTGLDLLKNVRESGAETPVIMITGHADVQLAIDAMKQGAYDFITKPLKIDELIITVRNALERSLLSKEVGKLRGVLKEKYDFKNIIGESPRMDDVFKVMGQVIGSNVTVLIQGESGTGKELVAHAIHFNSDRQEKPFVIVNCGAIPDNLLESELFGYERGAFTGALERHEGKFEQADKGTIFLDEIGDLTPQTQVKLLRVLQNRTVERLGGNASIKVDVRIISATNKDLFREVKAGRFREDLYYRLAVFPIILPPLRDRKDDIPRIALHFIEKFSKASSKHVEGISREAVNKLLEYSWPGNVRELENAMERAVLLCNGKEIKKECLPATILMMPKIETTVAAGSPVRGDLRSLEALEIDAIKKALLDSENNISKASKSLGISRATFYRKASKFNIITD